MSAPGTPVAEVAEGNAVVDVDLSDLISVSINSKQLQITLSNILRRLAKLEREGEGKEESASPATQDDDGLLDRLKALEDRVDGCRQDVDNTADTVKNHEEAIDGQRAKTDDLSERVAALEKGLAEAKEELAVAKADIDATKEDVASNIKSIGRLDEVKADKVDHVDPLEKEIEWVKEELKNLHNGLNGLNSRMTGIEGMQALANPDAAKDSGLASFTDTLSDLLNKQKQLEDKVDASARKDAADGNSHDKDVKALEDRLADVERTIDAEQRKFATQNDMEAAIKDVFEKVRRPSSSPGGKQGPSDGLSQEERDMLRTYPATAAEVQELKDALSKLRSNNDRPVDEGEASIEGNGAKPGAGSRGLVDLGARRASGLADKTELEALRARVKALEDALGRLGERVDANGALLKDHGSSINALGQECSRNADACNKLNQQKADRGEVRGGAIAGANGVDGNSGASREALQALAKEVGALRDQIKRLQQQQAEAPARLGDAAQPAAEGGVPATAYIGPSSVDEIQKRMDDLEDWAKGQVVDIRATVDHVHHNKADAASVANKAERDYVENAMEKLMHEVEHVLNATNAGLIDTLDKSLNILRDMIDGKATKGDIQKLQSLMAAGQNGADGRGGGNVPDGLTGVTSYRCLGCNRTMDAMRPRPMGGTAGSFLNRVPNNTRTVQSSQGMRPTGGMTAALAGAGAAITPNPSPPAGYINAPPRSS